jgi:hypothetical protein
VTMPTQPCSTRGACAAEGQLELDPPSECEQGSPLLGGGRPRLRHDAVACLEVPPERPIFPVPREPGRITATRRSDCILTGCATTNPGLPPPRHRPERTHKPLRQMGSSREGEDPP